MKKLIFILSMALGIASCSPQKGLITNTNPIKDSIMFEKFDIERNRKEYYKFKKIGSWFIMEDGTKFSFGGNYYSYWYYYVMPPTPNYFNFYYEYYSETGNLKFYGKYLGYWNCSDVKIGKWKYYDEKGILIKEVDEDKKFGEFSYNELLEFLDKQKEKNSFGKEQRILNLRTGENRENIEFFFDENTRLWTVEAINDISPDIWRRGWRYIIHTDTGELIRKERINNSAFPDPIEDQQKQSSSYYRTYQGKDYTKAEWEVFEQDQFNDYVKKHNIKLDDDIYDPTKPKES